MAWVMHLLPTCVPQSLCWGPRLLSSTNFASTKPVATPAVMHACRLLHYKPTHPRTQSSMIETKNDTPQKHLHPHLMFWLSLYDMRSNAPSGGMKLMVRSLSKRASRTHWWNLMSSRSTAFCLLLRP